MTLSDEEQQALVTILRTLESILVSIDPHYKVIYIKTQNNDYNQIAYNYLTDFPNWLGEQKHFPLNLKSLIGKLSDILILNVKLDVLLLNCAQNSLDENSEKNKSLIYTVFTFPVLLDFLTIPSSEVFSLFVKQINVFTDFLAQKNSKLMCESKSPTLLTTENSRNTDITDSNQNIETSENPTIYNREYKIYNSIFLDLVNTLQEQISICFEKETMPYLIKLLFPILKNFDQNSRSLILKSISTYIFTNEHLVAKYESMHNFAVIISNITLKEFNLYMSEFFFNLCSEKNWRIRNITIPATVTLIKSIHTNSADSIQNEAMLKRCIELFKTHLKDSVLTMAATSGRLLPEFLTYIPASLLDIELSKLLVEQIDKGNLDCKFNCYKHFPTILYNYLSGPLKLKSSPDLLLENLRKFLLFNVSLLNNKLKGNVVTNCLPECLQILNKYVKQNPTSQHYNYLKLTINEATEFYLLQIRKPEVYEYYGFEGFEKVYPYINSINRSLIFEYMYKMSQKTIFRAIFKIIETLECIINNNAEFIYDKENIIIIDIIRQLLLNPIFLIKKKINFSLAEFILKNKHKFVLNNDRTFKVGEIEETQIMNLFKLLKVRVSDVVICLYKLSEDKFGRFVINKYFLKELRNVYSLDEKLVVVKIVRNLIVNKEKNKNEWGLETNGKELDVILVKIFYMKKYIKMISDEYNNMVNEIEKGSDFKTVVMGNIIRDVLKKIKRINI